MKTPISYHGGKQMLVSTILPLIPNHTLYAEPFFGGGAIFFAKPKSEVEVINDTNIQLITFYKMVKERFIDLEKMIKITLHSREMHRWANAIYNNCDCPFFDDLLVAWSVWVKSAQGFGSKLDGSWGYDIRKNCTTKKITNKRESFTEDYAIRLQNVQIESTDALRIIESRDSSASFFYCDPPYIGTDLGHYDGYTEDDLIRLLDTLAKIKGKFLLSMYPNKHIDAYMAKHGWHQIAVEKPLIAAGKNRKPGSKKTEVLTANYPLKAT